MKIKSMDQKITICLFVVFGALFIYSLLLADGPNCSTSNTITCKNGNQLTCSCEGYEVGCTCSSDSGPNWCSALCRRQGGGGVICNNDKNCPPDI